MAAVVFVAAACVARGEKVEGIYRDLATCDNHGNQRASAELGNPAVFASDEQIEHAATPL
jgi:hypothetical protein